MEVIWPIGVLVKRRSNGNGHHGLMYFDIVLRHGLNNGECHAWQPWAPHVSRSSLLKLHGLTGAGFITASGATGCGVCRGWVTAFGWFHHLGNKWMALFFAQDPGHFAGERCRVIN